jgi:hydrogenase maturation factor
MGQRYEVYASPKVAESIIEIISNFGIDAKIIGEVLGNGNEEKNKLTIKTRGQEFNYE